MKTQPVVETNMFGSIRDRISLAWKSALLLPTFMLLTITILSWFF